MRQKIQFIKQQARRTYISITNQFHGVIQFSVIFTHSFHSTTHKYWRLELINNFESQFSLVYHFFAFDTIFSFLCDFFFRHFGNFFFFSFRFSEILIFNLCVNYPMRTRLHPETAFYYALVNTFRIFLRFSHYFFSTC